MRTQTPTRPTLFLLRLFRDVMPMARTELNVWRDKARNIPDAKLRTQALSSLTHKQFHADGGTVYAAANAAYAPQLVRLIVALQTISDYLDNLCDRSHVLEGPTFRQLHLSMHDAVNPDAPLQDYYSRWGSVDDGNYLSDLVQTCQATARQLPYYSVVQSTVAWYVARYSELQEHKHIHPELRQQKLIEWSEPYLEKFPDVRWYEFAAATGSTLGMFSLFLAATEEVEAKSVQTAHERYFPWICGLHILLDYLIDLDEDAREGDFNFVACYETPAVARARIRHFAHESRRRAANIPFGGRIHRFVVQGLLGMYLSDPKVHRQRKVRPVRRMLYTFDPTTFLFYLATRVYRKIG